MADTTADMDMAMDTAMEVTMLMAVMADIMDTDTVSMSSQCFTMDTVDIMADIMADITVGITADMGYILVATMEPILKRMRTELKSNKKSPNKSKWK